MRFLATITPQNPQAITLTASTKWSLIWGTKSYLTVRLTARRLTAMEFSQTTQNPCQIRCQALFGLSEPLVRCTLMWLLSSYFSQCQRLLGKGKNPEELLGQF